MTGNNEPDSQNNSCAECGQHKGHKEDCKVRIREANRRFLDMLGTPSGKAQACAELGANVREQRHGTKEAFRGMSQEEYEKLGSEAPGVRGATPLTRGLTWQFWQCGNCGSNNTGNDLSATCSSCGERGDGTNVNDDDKPEES